MKNLVLFRKLHYEGDVATHHPIVEVLKHVTSPLSAALAIFAFGRYKNRLAYTVVFKSYWNIFRAAKK